MQLFDVNTYTATIKLCRQKYQSLQRTARQSSA